MSHAAVRTRLAAALSAVFLVTMPGLADAQGYPQANTNAALQARAKMQQGHKQTGSIGNGYRPWSAWTYQNSARMHARALNAYGQSVQQLPPATAKEHLGEVRQNIAKTRAEIAKLGPVAAKEAEVKQHVDALEKHLAECEQLCGMMDKTVGQEGVETAQMCTHCSGLEEKLKAAEVEHRALLKALGLEPPIPVDDQAERPLERGTVAEPKAN